MALQIEAVAVPLVMGSDGVVRVRGTRVTLDTIIPAFCRGATAEEIAQQFPVLALDDVYAVIAFYLRHRDEVDAYVEDGRNESQRIKAWVETRFPPDGIRERLLARRAQRKDGSDAPLGGR